MIKVIEIENIKGISHKRFELDITPNRPSLLVAPNGFGKSSLATAFNSMNNNRIILDDDDFHNENQAMAPRIFIEYKKPDETIVDLEATSATNTISSELDYFVINNQTKPKGIGSLYGGKATAVLEIPDIVLVDKIPDNVSFNYSYRSYQTLFGCNSKVIPNLNDKLLTNMKLVEKLSENYQTLQKCNGDRVQTRINKIINNINAQQGRSETLLAWIEQNELSNLKQIDPLSAIGNLINKFDNNYTETESYLLAIPLIWLYNQDASSFKKACAYSNYRFDRMRFDRTLTDFNSTWKNIRSSETHGKLVVKFPKATSISNGQRDTLTFISMLFRAKRHLKRNANILIIDEVFDYLDDANLAAAQYYITAFIEYYKKNAKRIYPLILTHLDPVYFENFVFSKQKVYYLDKSDICVNPHIERLLRNRNNISIKEDVDKFLFHYNPGKINKRAEFKALLLPEKWGEADTFAQKIKTDVDNYLNNRLYDPFAVCCALRLKIEEVAYNKLQTPDAKTEFLMVHGTRNKLKKAEEMGILSPESHYLLGLIYNDGMHWKDDLDNVSPIVSKLKNQIIKKMIRDVFR